MKIRLSFVVYNFFLYLGLIGVFNIVDFCVLFIILSMVNRWDNSM